MQNKYQKMMEHIEVNEEMHQRLMERVSSEYAGAKQKKHPSILWKRYIPVFTVLVIAIIATTMIHTSQNNDPVLGPVGFTEYQTLSELEDAAGFTIEEAESLPFTVTEITYTLIEENLVQIDYSGENETIVFRKSSGMDDNSGDFTVYEVEEVMKLDGWNVICKGDQSGYALVMWTDGTYQYSFRSDNTYSWTEWESVIRQLEE